MLLEPIRTEDGTIVGFAKECRTTLVSRREADRRLADTLRELDAVLNTMADGLITIDDQFVIRSFTPSAERIFGYRAAEVVGRGVNMLMPQPGRVRRSPRKTSMPSVRLTAAAAKSPLAARTAGQLFPGDRHHL